MCIRDRLWLVDVSPAYEYKEGKRSDTILGYRYSIALPEHELDKDVYKRQVMYSPLYRLEQEFNRQGLRLSRQTMANWLLNTSEKWPVSYTHLLIPVCVVLPCYRLTCVILYLSF